MNALWEGVKATAGIVGQAAVETGMKGKLQADLMLINLEIENRKRTFGEELYEYVEPLSKTPDFYAANDRMTDTLRGPLLTAQREVAALDIRRRKTLEKVSVTETAEKTAYTTATTWQETLSNTAKKAGFVSHHAKLKAELGMVEVQIKDFKQVFGLELFQVLVDLEDIQGWLPTVRDIRSIYDQCRRDIEKIHVRRKEKEVELAKLGGVPMVQTSEASKYNDNTNNDDGNDDANKPSYFKQVAAAEAGASAMTTAAAVATAPVVPTIKSIGGPLSYAVPSTAPMPTVDDPFATFGTTATSTNLQPPKPQHSLQPPLQLPLPSNSMDPFASGSGHDSFGSMSAPMGMGGSLTSSGAMYDPFDFTANGTAPANTLPVNNNATGVPQQSYNDPFATLDSSDRGSHPSGLQQQASNDNPLFRY